MQLQQLKKTRKEAVKKYGTATWEPAIAPPIRRLKMPNQNPELKLAWEATGLQLYEPASPFHDPSQPQERVKIMRLSLGDGESQRICLSMALRGSCYSNCTGYHGPLTQLEVDAVARVGGLHLSKQQDHE